MIDFNVLSEMLGVMIIYACLSCIFMLKLLCDSAYQHYRSQKHKLVQLHIQIHVNVAWPLNRAYKQC